MQQSQNNMITPIDKIPLKTTGNSNDDTNDDPMIRDVLNEFEQELAINESQSSNKYKINEQRPVHQYAPSQQPQQPSQQFQQPSQQPSQQPQPSQSALNQKKNKSYIDNDLLIKSFIICIVIAIIINPYIFSTIISKVPENISALLTSYDYFIKLVLIFAVIYGLFFYNLL
jgi:hypothetical protein